MNNIILMIYLADIVGSIQVVSTLGCIIIVLSLIIAITLYTDTCLKDEYRSRVGKLIKYLSVGLIFSLLIAMFIPSKQGVYMMTGLKAGSEIVHSETGTKALKILNLKLDEYLNDLQKEENK